jgi:hypothetical protein
LENELKERHNKHETLFEISPQTKLIDLVNARDFVFSDYNIDPNAESLEPNDKQHESETFRSVYTELTEVENENDDDIDDAEEEVKNEENQIVPNLKLKSTNSLYRKYKVSLIRYECLKKLNTELTYARGVLEKASQTQAPYLKKCRGRVEWLEKEIEMLILLNKKVYTQLLI